MMRWRCCNRQPAGPLHTSWGFCASQAFSSHVASHSRLALHVAARPPARPKPPIQCVQAPTAPTPDTLAACMVSLATLVPDDNWRVVTLGLLAVPWLALMSALRAR